MYTHTYIYIHLSFTHLSIYPSIHLSIYLSFYLSIFLSIYLNTSIYIHIYIHIQYLSLVHLAAQRFGDAQPTTGGKTSRFLPSAARQGIGGSTLGCLTVKIGPQDEIYLEVQDT